MAVVPKKAVMPPAGAVAQIDEVRQSAGLWADAWRRLLRNRMAVLGLAIILFMTVVALFAPVLAPKDYRTQVLPDRDATPYWVTRIFVNMVPVEAGGYVRINNEYVLGADNLGRDLLSRIIYGAQVSLLVAFIGPLAALAVGLPYGLISGYAGGSADNLMMRFVDIMYAFPTLLFIILLMAFFRASFAQAEVGSFSYTLARLDQAAGGMLFIFIGIGLTSWMDLARLVRGQVLSVREKEYIEAARAIGTPTIAIMFRHIMPNIIGPVIVSLTLTIPRYISFEAFLSFIGLGVVPPTPSWGGMIADAANRISTYPNQAIFPALALFLIMFSFNFLGDGLRDALDPRMRGRD
jgi:oligopeptide transport system permease protein